MRDSHAQLLGWANQAILHYNLVEPIFTFLGQHDTATFRVDEPTTGGRSLLRLHRPHDLALARLHHQPQAIHAELIWLNALAYDTSIPIARPIRNRASALVTLLELSDGELLPVTLLDWVEGDPFPTAGMASKSAAAALGHLLAALHHHASTWRAPEDLDRPVYNEAFVDQVTLDLQLGVAAGIIAQADADVIQDTLAAIRQTITMLPRTAETWGMIHADLHPGNCLIMQDVACPIDFALCGMGFYLFDLATSLASLEIALRQPLLAAYATRRVLPESMIALIEAFFLLTRMSAYAFALPNTEQHAWLRRRIPQAVETICHPFLQGKRFLFAAR